MTKPRAFLGIDTSNYTTSVAVCDENGKIIANRKKLLDVKEGELGLRQSDAVFSHIKNFPILANELREVIKDYSIAAVGVSTKPRDVEGSYMPCFLSGKSVAEMIASTHNVPVYEFSHQAGHIIAALYSSRAINNLLTDSFVAFHISGGTTEALLVNPADDSFDISIIAETADISAGQAIDRAGVMMGLKFPCGKELELLASGYSGKLPTANICVKNLKCNLSGLENLAAKIYKDTDNRELVSAFVLDFIARTLTKITKDIRELYPDIPIVYAGGVMSNKYLKQTLESFSNTYFSEPQFSADNAAGVALLTQRSFFAK